MKVRSYWIKLAAGLAIVVLLFLFKVNLAKTGAEIRNSIPQWILLAGALHIIGLLLSAYRWQILLAAQHIEAPFWDLLKSYLIGGFFNNFLPTRVGGDVYRLIDSKRYSGSLLRPAAVIVVERLSGIYGLLLIGVTAVAFYPRFEEVKPLAMALFALTIGGFLAILIFYGSESFGLWLKRMIGKLPAKISAKLLSIFESFWYFSRSKGTVFYAFVLGILLQLNVILYYFFIAQGLRMNISLQEASIVMPILICIQLLPLTPNGVGVREFSYIYLMKPFGVSEAQAVAFSFWDYILTFAYGLIGGILFLFQRKDRKETAEVKS
ncbi:MAG TPA: lysylphosphatidylglycerol synthase transmembrane domain-containing protein [Acidobacteriota bacterium]|nr:lysylphosphatidylglycerol synthase transmembrane domain-containing protein [Acidobacteriota bacterium]